MKYFSIKELTKSDQAVRLGLDNSIKDAQIITNLKLLCENILDPIRDYFNKPVQINSAYRSLEVNRAVGSKDTSQHTMGKAADIEIKGVDNLDLAIWVRNNLEYDQLILEFYDGINPDSGWVHVSYNQNFNRKENLIINKNGTKKWEL